MKNKTEKLTYLFLWIFLVAVVACISLNIFEKDEVETESQTSEDEILDTNNELVVTEDETMIGVWISYISLSTSENTEEAFKANFDALVADAKSVNATDLFVHVRAFSDAFYDSDYYPWSHLLTGTQGVDPEFDPLEYMIEKTHSEGMNFHAWINPLRVSLTTVPSSLSDDNPYSLYSDDYPYYFIECDGTITINPAYKEMRTLVANGVAEIVENYDVDGIHFDDYFYPDGISTEDLESYNAYCETVLYPLTIEQWRATNVNTLIAQVYRTIKEIDEDVVFGISPQANLENNELIGADVYSWCSTYGYIDYICPQIYFSYDNAYLGFSESLEQWLAIPKYDGLEFYVGLGLYKAGTDSDDGTWDSDDIIINQYLDSIEAGADGVILYDVRSITREEALDEVENFVDGIS